MMHIECSVSFMSFLTAATFVCFLILAMLINQMLIILRSEYSYFGRSALFLLAGVNTG